MDIAVIPLKKREIKKNEIDNRILKSIPDQIKSKKELFSLIRMDSKFKDNEIFKKKDELKDIFEKEIQFDFKAIENIWNAIFSENSLKLNVADNNKNYTLSEEEERILFLRLNYAKYKISKILKTTQESNRQLNKCEIEKAFKWGRILKDCKDMIAISNIGLVTSMGKKFGLFGSNNPNEMITEGLSALLRAIDGFDVSRGFKFSTYACRSIIKAMNKEKMENDLRMKSEISSDFELTSICSKDKFRKLDELNDLKIALEKNSARLNEQELIVIRGRFFSNEKLQEVGNRIGVCKERVRQIQKNAIIKLKNVLFNVI